MSDFLYEVDEEKFYELRKQTLDEKAKVALILNKLVENEDLRRFNFVLINLGELMKICTIELNMKSDEIETYLKLKKDKIREGKMKKIIKELNQKINLRFKFPEDETEMIRYLYTFNGVGYIFLEESLFCEILEETEIPITTIDNV